MQRAIASPQRTLQWDDARLLLALLRAPTLVAAARTLGIDKSTLSRRMDGLEAALSARLFLRGRDDIRPSPVGERLRVHAERMEAEMLALTSAAIAGGEEVSLVPRAGARDLAGDAPRRRQAPRCARRRRAHRRGLWRAEALRRSGPARSMARGVSSDARVSSTG